MAGDAYFYSHATNPYPFTAEQISAINDITFQNVFCKVLNIGEVQALWHLTASSDNPKVSCKNLKPYNFKALSANLEI